MLKAKNLRKQFTTVLAVDDVSLEVQRGGIFGLIGPNGAGKSTTIRMLLNIIKPDSGTITYDGEPFTQLMRNRIGYLPEERGLYKKNGLLDVICYFAGLRGIPPAEARKKGMQWLERFELQAYAKRKVEELSKGNQQKAQFITSILHDPELVILDEPFSGLDPVNQILMKNIFQELKQQGKAVIFSTHQMDTAEKLCDELCLINHGKIVLEGTVKGVKKKFGNNSLHLEFEGDGSFISTLPFVQAATIYENYAEVVLKDTVSSREIIDAVSPKIDLRKFEFVEPSLNSIFLDVVGIPNEQNTDSAKNALPAVPLQLVSKDPRVRKQLFSVIFSLVMMFGSIAYTLRNGKNEWMLPAVFCFAVVVSLYKYSTIKKTVVKEHHSRSEGGLQ